MKTLSTMIQNFKNKSVFMVWGNSAIGKFKVQDK
jgi:hypothetical protein